MAIKRGGYEKRKDEMSLATDDPEATEIDQPLRFRGPLWLTTYFPGAIA